MEGEAFQAREECQLRPEVKRHMSTSGEHVPGTHRGVAHVCVYKARLEVDTENESEGCKRGQKGTAEHTQGFKWATPHTRVYMSPRGKSQL